MVLEVEPRFLDKQVRKLAKEVAKEVARELKRPRKRTPGNKKSK